MRATVAEPAQPPSAEPAPREMAAPLPPAAPRPAGPVAAAKTAPAHRPATGKSTARHPVHVPLAGKGGAAASIGSDEVTVGRFRACVKAGACKAEQFLADTGHPCNWGVEGRDDHPMNCVDWSGASAFCKFDGGRLCKADEWFAACRGSGDSDYPYG